MTPLARILFLLLLIAGKSDAQFSKAIWYFDDINCQTASSRLAQLSPIEFEVALNGNPLSEASMLLFSDKIPNGTFLRIYSSDSKLIQIIALPENSTTYSLGKLDLAPGLYILKISSSGLDFKTIKLSKR